jgi:hypothetical protein
MKERAGDRLAVGAQACHPEAFGAFTGDLSAEMLSDAGADYVVVGHSERRSEHGERSAYVQEQAHACLRLKRQTQLMKHAFSAQTACVSKAASSRSFENTNRSARSPRTTAT